MEELHPKQRQAYRLLATVGLIRAMRIQTNEGFTGWDSRTRLAGRTRRTGFTLAEVVISVAVMCLVFSGILMGYVQSAKRAEWSGYSLASQAYGIQQLEQARAAVWDISSSAVVNQITNLNLINWTFSANAWRGYSWTNIDIPYSGTNYMRATNFVIVSNITLSVTPPVAIQSVEVATVWMFKTKLFTNKMVNYYAADQ